MSTFLRQRRTLMKMSQTQLADHIGVSQQTVARWETSGQIPARYIKDLAILMGARAQDFLPRFGEGPGKPGSNVIELRGSEGSGEEPNEDADTALPFGDVCFRFAGEPTGQVRRFPVTWGTLNHIQEQLGDAGTGFSQLSTWIEFKALNNKWIAVNTQQVDRVTFVDDDAEEMTDYKHDEVYKAARDLLYRMPGIDEMDQEDFPYSQTLVDQAKTLTEGFGPQAHIELMGMTIEFTSGQRESKSMNPEAASSLDYLFSGGGNVDARSPGFLQLAFRDDGVFEHVRLDGIRLIEAAHLAFLEACQEEG